MVRSYRAPQIAARVQPGQFVEAALPPAAQTFLRRPFAVFDADPKAGTISLMIQEAGAGTRWLVAHPEAELDFLGPLGQPWRLPEKPAEALLIGGGVGAAPLLLLARALPDCQVVLGAQNLDQLVARAYFGEGANTHYCTDDGSFAHHGFVTDLSADLIAQG
ncbi:MAG: dihydroorotate dehydrogenase electron transfer subunit, partial [Coriobacteriales bacterium]|nr:dihydroorotate dehydrogenase electron transfer subunit [Coriobacteriales bacterium]